PIPPRSRWQDQGAAVAAHVEEATELAGRGRNRVAGPSEETMQPTARRVRRWRDGMRDDPQGFERIEAAAFGTHVNVKCHNAGHCTRRDRDQRIGPALPEPFLNLRPASARIILAVRRQRELAAEPLLEWEHEPAAARISERGFE